MASAIAIMVGGALVNALAFTGSSYLFSMAGKDHRVDAERQRHDVAEENLQDAQDKYARARAERLDWLNEELHRENHATRTFKNVDDALYEYYQVTGKTLLSDPAPRLSDFYTPSADQKDREVVFVVVGMGVATAVAVYIALR
jgi:DUF1680 family protein